MTFVRSLILLIFASSALATPISIIDDDLNDLFVPGPKVAAAEEAWYLYTNPAAISFIEGAEFVGGYAYRVSTTDSGRHFAAGTAGLSLIEGLTAGIGLQLSLPALQAGDDQGVIGGSLGLAWRYKRYFALGGRIVKQRQYKNVTADPFLFGLGFESFPLHWLSLGTSFSQVYDDILSKPELRLGIAAKFFDDQLTVSTECSFLPTDPELNTNFTLSPELALRLDLGGFSSLASVRFNNVAHGISAPTVFIGLELNFDHVGVGTVVKGHPSDRATMGGRFRLSSEVWPPLAPKRESLFASNPS